MYLAAVDALQIHNEEEDEERRIKGQRAAETTGLVFTQLSYVELYRRVVEIACVKVRPVSSATLDNVYTLLNAVPIYVRRVVKFTCNYR